MTDLEITRLCAEAMGWRPAGERKDFDRVKCIPVEQFPGATHYQYAPLKDDGACLALVKKFHLHISIWEKLDGHEAGWWRVDAQDGSVTCRHDDLNRAICECVAKLKQGEP